MTTVEDDNNNDDNDNDTDNNATRSMVYDCLDDSEIFGAAPSSVVDAADAAGARAAPVAAT